MASVSVIDRFKTESELWFRGLDEPAKKELEKIVKRLLDILTRDSRVQDKVAATLDKLDTSWKGLSPVQRRAQVEGVIDIEGRLRGDSEALEGIEWYEQLSPEEQDRVRFSVQTNTRIRRAVLRTVTQYDEKEIQATNPWHHLLNP